jgi:hypothetical protein
MPDLLESVTKHILGLIKHQPWEYIIDATRGEVLARELIKAYLASRNKKTESQLVKSEISDLMSKITTVISREAKKSARIGDGEFSAVQKFFFDVRKAFESALKAETHIPTEPSEAPSIGRQPYPDKTPLDLTLPREALNKMFKGLIADIFSVNSITKMLDEGLDDLDDVDDVDDKNKKRFSFEEIRGLLNAYFLHGMSNAWIETVRKVYHLSSQIVSMIKIADALDEAGYEQEADEIDSIVRGLLNDQQS